MIKPLHLALACAAAIPLAGCAGPGTTSARPTFENPILYADYSDPDLIRVGTDYYMVSSSFHLSPGIPVLKSGDLVHWTIIGHVLPRLPFAPEYDMPGPHMLDDTRSKPIGGTRYASGVWAPAIRHHQGKFYVYWATPDEGVFMSTATDPTGPWSAPITVIGQPGLEDPCPFWDEDGQAWLVHSRVGAGPLVLHRMSADGTRVLDAGEVIVEDKVNLPILEGPKLYKRNGWYYIFAPIGGVSTGPQAVLRARSIRGPYEHRVILEPGASPLAGPHQGGWVETPSGEGWFAHFNSTGAFGRIVHLQPVRWENDWPIIGEPLPGKTAGQPVATYAMPDTGNAPSNAAIQASDEFDSAVLGLQWSWNHNPDNSAWSLTARPGFLRLNALPADHLVTARNTLTQILQGPARRYTARIDPAGMVDGQRAGVSLFGVGPSWIGLIREGAQTQIAVAERGKEAVVAVLTGKSVDLRAEVREDQTVQYSFSLDGHRFNKVEGAVPLAPFSWWKGSRPALFTFRRSGTAGGAIDIDWFRSESLPAGR